METDSLNDTIVSVVDGDPGDSIEAPSNDNERLEERLSNKEVMREIVNDLIRLEMDLARCSEKLVNLNLLMMHVAEKENEFESFILEKEDTLVNCAEVALEFDILSGFSDLEVKEMDNFIGRLQMKLKNACDAISSYKHPVLEEKLHDVEKSLKQSQEHVSELMMQSAQFQRIVVSANRGDIFEDKDTGFEGNDDFFNTPAKLQMQTSEQQRHVLEMLEKSLARELDLEKQLTECKQTLDKMKHKLHYSQRQVLSAEEETAAVYARFLEADNASTVLMGISKELIGQIQSSQLTINSSLCRENELNVKLQNCMQAIEKLETKEVISQELAEKNTLESLALKEKVNSVEEQLKASESALLNGVTCEKIDSLEDQLRETGFQLQQAMVSIEASEERQSMLCASIEDMEIVIEKLKTNVTSAESRAETAESECILLAEAYKEVNKELDVVKASSVSSEKVALLEKQLWESDNRLQEATASLEACQKKQSMLYSSINNLEILNEKLNSKVIKADARADSAEDKCIILSESHAELNDELNFIRGKVGSLEASLQQAEETKLAAAKDINIRTEIITDLVLQLAIERERLQNQVTWLMKDNRACKDELLLANKISLDSVNSEIGETEKGALSSQHHLHSFDTGIGGKNIPGFTEVHKSAEHAINGESNSELQELKSKLETVRTIEAGRLNFKYVLSASLVVFIAVLATCFISPENCPF